MVMDGEPINVKVVPSRLYANWFCTPGEAAYPAVPLNRASIVESESCWPGTDDSVSWK